MWWDLRVIFFYCLVVLISCLRLSGRYCKFSRTLSQTPWVIDGERKTPTSVQVQKGDMDQEMRKREREREREREGGGGEEEIVMLTQGPCPSPAPFIRMVTKYFLIIWPVFHQDFPFVCMITIIYWGAPSGWHKADVPNHLCFHFPHCLLLPPPPPPSLSLIFFSGRNWSATHSWRRCPHQVLWTKNVISRLEIVLLIDLPLWHFLIQIKISVFFLWCLLAHFLFDDKAHNVRLSRAESLSHSGQACWAQVWRKHLDREWKIWKLDWKPDFSRSNSEWPSCISESFESPVATHSPKRNKKEVTGLLN